jgi:hypothetical protein
VIPASKEIRDQVISLLILCSAKLLDPFKSNKEGVSVNVVRRSKNEAENATIWNDIIDQLKREGVSMRS